MGKAVDAHEGTAHVGGQEPVAHDRAGMSADTAAGGVAIHGIGVANIVEETEQTLGIAAPIIPTGALGRHEDKGVILALFADVAHIAVGTGHVQIVAALTGTVEEKHQRIGLALVIVLGQIHNVIKTLPGFLIPIVFGIHPLHPRFVVFLNGNSIS